MVNYRINFVILIDTVYVMIIFYHLDILRAKTAYFKLILIKVKVFWEMDIC